MKMMYALSLVLLLFSVNIFAQNKNYAFDASIGLSNTVTTSSTMFFPVPSVSFYWLKTKGIHELSAEFHTKEIEKRNQRLDVTLQSHYGGFGMAYSFLFKIPVKWMYIGPAIGVFGYWSSEEKEEASDTYFGVNYIEQNGHYFAGCKFAFLFGEQTVRLKIQDRLLAGIQEDGDFNSRYGFFNTVSLSLLFAI